jgi:hypothetical protein
VIRPGYVESWADQHRQQKGRRQEQLAGWVGYALGAAIAALFLWRCI